MEFVVSSTILALGYFLSKDKDKEKGIKNGSTKKVKKNFYPSGKTIYESKQSQRDENEIQKLSGDMYKKMDIKYSNVVMPGPPQSFNPEDFNKVDKSAKPIPVEFNKHTDENDLETIKKNEKIRPDFTDLRYKAGFDSGGFHGVALTGEPVDPKTFVHNNMVPFFGSTVKQNVDETSTRGIFESFTGTNTNYIEKKEVGRFFNVENNVTNPYGAQNLDGYQMERYYVSNRRNNEAPIDRINIGPGLNKGFTAQPSGGFQQANKRDYILPKNVDQLRNMTNPKVTYEGRIITGQHISKPGKIGEIEKRRPDRFYVNNPDMYFTTTGAISGPKQRANILLKSSNRKETTKSHVGPAGVTHGSSMKGRKSKIKKSDKDIFGSFGWRNLEEVGKWFGLEYNYGKSKKKLQNIRKEQVECNKREGNIQAKDKAGAIHNQKLRKTRKTNAIGNIRQTGNLQYGYGRGWVKETDDVAKTTIKETNIDNNHTGNLDSNPKGWVKETADIAKTTIKETNIDNNHTGNMGDSKYNSYVKDTNDVAKTTQKQFTVQEDYLGAPDGEDKAGYAVADAKVKSTNRQDTSVYYTNNAEGDQKGGYKIAKPEAKGTSRQDTTRDYTGLAGGDSKPVSYEDIYNATISGIRENVSKGRNPANSGAKKGTNSDNIKMTTRKSGDLKNKILNDRGTAPTKVYNSLPQVNSCAETKDRMDLPNEPLQQRLDPSMLDALHKNPYVRPFDWAG